MFVVVAVVAVAAFVAGVGAVAVANGCLVSDVVAIVQGCLVAATCHYWLSLIAWLPCC